MEDKKVTVYSWDQLLNKAILKGCDSLFIQLIKDKPLYPKDHADHDIKEFGQKVSATGEGKGNKWLSDFEFGYILARMHKSEKHSRRREWFEVCFPSVSAWGDPVEYTVGLYAEEIEFKELEITKP